MKSILKPIGSVIKFVFGLFVIGFISTLTYGFAQKVYPTSPILQAMLLGLFDIAAIVWYIAFMKVSDGTWQRVVAGLMFLVSIIGIALVVAAETITGPAAKMIGSGITPESLQGYATIGIVVLAVLNTISFYAFYGVSPKNLKAMQEAYIAEREAEHENRMLELQADVRDEILKETEDAMRDEAKRKAKEIAQNLMSKEMDLLYSRLGVQKLEDGTIISAQWRDPAPSGAPQARLSAPPPADQGDSRRRPLRFRSGPNKRKGNRAWNLPGFIKKALVTTMECPNCHIEAVMSDLGNGQYECQNCSAVLSLQGHATPAPIQIQNGNGHHPNDPTQAP